MPVGDDEGYPRGDGWRSARGGHGEGCRAACRGSAPYLRGAGAAQQHGPPRSRAALPGGAAAGARPGPARPGGGRSRSPAGVEGEFGSGKAAAEIYDAGGQSVKAVYHPQVGLKERKHIFNKKRGFAIQLRC